MAQNAGNIHQGPCRIFIGVTAPATGTPPTRMAHTAGVPATGTEVGHTEGDAVFTYKQSMTEMRSEQALGPIDAFVTDEMAQVTFLAMERVYATLKLAMNSTGNLDDANATLFYGGGTALSVFTQAIMISSPLRTNIAKFEVSVLYKAYSVDGYEIAYSRGRVSTYRITLKGLADTSRSVGDQLFQHYREK